VRRHRHLNEHRVAADVGDELQGLRVPSLSVFGSADSEVPVAEKVVPLVLSLVTAKSPDFTVAVLLGRDHFSLELEGHRVEKHQYGKMDVAPGLLEVMTTWIQRQVQRGE
jgi:hypothetical protein